jgi:beta-lactamase class D
MPKTLALIFSVLVVACAPRPVESAASSAPAPPASGVAVGDGGMREASPASASPHERSELRQYFDAEGVGGTIALFDSVDGTLSCSDVARCIKPVLPASTFKIANSMIALETSVVDDAETVLPWDQQPYPIEDWNQDLTLRAAVRLSCVPCFQAIARKVGAERMSDWVKRLDYGNRDTSGGIDQFWLTGKLRISPLQQIDFLRRFDGGKLPIQERTAEIVRDLITLDVGQNHVLRGKTGLSRAPQTPLLGWFVGWLELGERRVFFATLIDAISPDVDIVPVRRRVTERVLRGLNLLPADAAKAQTGG